MMKKLFFGLIVLILLFISSFFLFREKLAGYVTHKIEAEALNHKVALDFTEPDLGLLNYQAKSLAVQKAIGFLPLTFNLKNLRIFPDLLSTLRKQPAGNFSFQIYGGEVKGYLAQKADGFILKNLEVINVNLPQIFIAPPMFVKSLKSRLSYHKKKLKIDFLDLNSDLGGLYLSGGLFIQGQNIVPDNFTGKVRLSKLGQSSLGNYLPLVSSSKLTKSNTNFDFAFQGMQNGMPVFRFEPQTS